MKRKRNYVGMSVALLFLLSTICAFAVGQAETAKEVTVKFWHGYPEFTPVWEQMASKDFMEENPSIKIEISSFPLKEYLKKMALALPAGTAPDLHYWGISWYAKYIESGLINKPPSFIIDYVKKSIPETFQDRAFYNGELWGLPFDGYIPLAFWNKTMYEEAGLDHAPTNWDELVDFAKKTTKYDTSGNVVRSGISLRLGGFSQGLAEKFWYFLLPAGGEILDKGKEIGKYHVGYNNDAGKETLKLHLDLLYKYKCDSHDIKHDSEAFALEQTAYFQRETWVIGYMKEHGPNVKYGTARLPIKERDATVVSSHIHSVTEKSTVKEEAWKFALFLQKERYLKEVMKRTGWLPARRDISYEDILKEIPLFKPAMHQPEYATDMPLNASVMEVYMKFGERLQAAYQDKKLVDNPAGIEKVIAEAAKETTEILKEANEYGE